MKTHDKILIYQVLPRLFGNDNKTNKPNGSIEENGCGKLSAFTAKVLNEIKDMGFTHIWYTGLLEHATKTDYSQYGIKKDHKAIVKGNAGSPYAIKDYYDIDPDLADDVNNRKSEFDALVLRTHKAGLKFIMDFVPNHVARKYHSDTKPKGVIDLGKNDNNQTTFDPNNNFYYIPGQKFAPDFSLHAKGEKNYCELPAKVTGNDCFSANPTTNDWYDTVKLNYGVDYLSGGHRHFDPVPDTWNKMRDILVFWAQQHVDGFRCDMAELVPVEFWEWAIPQVKQINPEIIFIAEIYKPDRYREYIYKGKFDYLYDKVCLYDTLRQVITNGLSTRTLTSCWQSVDDIYPRLLNFLENHDEQRIASDFFAGDARKALPALYVSVLINTNPFMLYFGQELGERGMDAEGFSGQDGRTTIFDYWSIDSVRNWRHGEKQLTDEQQYIRKRYLEILRMCNDCDAIREGKFFDLMYVNMNNPHFNPDKQYAFLRGDKDKMLLIVANFDNEDKELEVFLPAHAFDYFEVVNDKNLVDSYYRVSVKASDGIIVSLLD